ncbi:zona pellucida protein AX 4 [Sardina pilchardus]|uniref:zona pellucida protein AX 4 n=1 Tax=Sardina pilchardus TaxID=27697 RepID=UPI002E11021A
MLQNTRLQTILIFWICSALNMCPNQSMRVRILLGLMLYVNHTLCSVSTPPLGTFVTSCHERSFWVSVNSSFLGHKARFDIEDGTGIHLLSSQRAAECGYTILFDRHGNLVFRASYLACYVDSKADSEFWLQVWFVHWRAGGRVRAYPLRLHCLLPQPWSPRDVICEENYMEVSVKPQIPAPHSHRQKWMDAPLMSSEGKEQLKQEGLVVFYRPGVVKEPPLAVREVLSLGYVINVTETRVLLRCAYSSPRSHTLTDKGVLVEAVSAFIQIQTQGLVTVMDVSMACIISDAVVEGEQLVWLSPLILSPLVHGIFKDSSVRLGVGRQALSECIVRDRGYKITSNDGVLQVRIPFGAEGTFTQSVGVNRQLSKVVSLDLFLMHEWQDDLWPLTQHRTFRSLHSPYLPHTPVLINNTVCSEKTFSVTVGVFPREMSLKSVSIGGEAVAWPEARQQAILFSQIHFRNGSFIYQLRVPFSYPTISQKRIRGSYRRLSLAFTLTLSLNAEEFDYNATVVCDEKEADTGPWLEGRCKESSVQVQLHYGSRERPWELRLGGRPLDWELMELGNYEVEQEDDYLIVGLPLSAPGVTYESVTLQGVVAKVEASVVELDSVHEEHTLTQRCSLPVRELLACLPEGRMVVVVDTSWTLPPTPPNRTTLMDPSCGPTQTDSTRALFNFALDSCGTTQNVDGEYLVYENHIIYTHDLQQTDEPVIHRHSPYRLTIQCRFPANHTSVVSLQHPTDASTSMPLPPKNGHHRSKRRLQWHSFVRGLQARCLYTVVHTRNAYFAIFILLNKSGGEQIPLKVTAMCKETSILFSMEHSAMDVQWEIGNLALTQLLAMIRGYIIQNNTRDMTLEVPLFSVGYRYEDINLEHFYGSFEVIFRDTDTWNVTETKVQRCLFKTRELIVCDPKGVVSVVTTTAMVLPPLDPNRTSLLDSRCRPVETDNSRMLFVFTVDTCGTRSWMDANYLTYENEIVLIRDLSPAKPIITRDSNFRLTVRCYYRSAGTAILSVDSIPREGPLTPGTGYLLKMRQDKTRKRSRFKAVGSDFLGIVRAKAAFPQAQRLT